MRRLLASTAIVLGLGVTGPAAGQALTPTSDVSAALQTAAFTAPASAAQAPAPHASYAPQVFTSQTVPNMQLLDRETVIPGQGPIRWQSGEVSTVRRGGAVDTVRMSVGGGLQSPGGVRRGLDRTDFDGRAYEVSYSRSWPAAVSVGRGKYGLDVSPHAGLGYGSGGTSAEAGAIVTFGQRAPKASDLGFAKADGEHPGFRDGRWYLFAAASGKRVGWDLAGGDQQMWSKDRGARIADAQVGVGWQKGSIQTAFGVMRRNTKANYLTGNPVKRKDSMIGFSFAIRPSF